MRSTKKILPDPIKHTVYQVRFGTDNGLQAVHIAVQERQALVYSAVARVHDLVSDLGYVLGNAGFELGELLPVGQLPSRNL